MGPASKPAPYKDGYGMREGFMLPAAGAGEEGAEDG